MRTPTTSVLRPPQPHALSHSCAANRPTLCAPSLQEFPARDRSYYSQALADGRLRVEGVAQAALTLHTQLREGQRLRLFVHRHEPPVPIGGVQVRARRPARGVCGAVFLVCQIPP